jgi:hypothetical protein
MGISPGLFLSPEMDIDKLISMGILKPSKTLGTSPDTYRQPMGRGSNMEEKREFEVPEVTSYDKEELEIHTAFTGDGSGNPPPGS